MLQVNKLEFLTFYAKYHIMGSKISRLEQVRAELGLTKAQFAQAMGITANYYTHISNENGKGNLRLEHLESLLHSQNINPGWIMTGEGNKYLSEDVGVKPKVTATILKAVVSEGFPKGWEKTWLSKVLDSVCEKVVSTNDNLSLVEMQNAVLKSTLILSAQIEQLINSSSDPGDTINLNLEGELYVIRRNNDDSQ